MPLKEVVTLGDGLWNQSTVGFAEGASLQLLGGKAQLTRENIHIIIMIIEGGNNLKVVYVTGYCLETLLFHHLPTPPRLSYPNAAVCSNFLSSWPSPLPSPCNTNTNPEALAVSTGIDCISTGNDILSC